MTNKNHLLAGCSFTDPLWQDTVPWSVYYSKTYHKSYIVAKAGMGWSGICTEAYMYARQLDISHCVIMLPTVWRCDIEVNHEGTMCNAMVDLLEHDQVIKPSERKWIVSGGLNYQHLDKELVRAFDWQYQYKNFLSIFRSHALALKTLQLYLKSIDVTYTVTAIRDPMEQLEGMEYIQNELEDLLHDVEYNTWLKFDGKFINEWLIHDNHPTTKEHKQIGDYIWQNHLT